MMGAPDPRARLVERNDVGLARFQSQSPGGAFGDEGDAAWFSLPIPAGRFNCVLRARLSPRHADARIGQLLAPYERRRVPHGWVVGPGSTPRDLPRRLEKHGLRHLFDLRGMAATLSKLDLESPPPKGLTIHTVEWAAQLRPWVDAMARGFEDPPSEARAVFRMERALGFGPDVPRVHFSGRVRGTLVATSFLFTDGKSAGVYNVATAPAWRGRGFGSAMTTAALRHARDMGYRVCVLLSTPQGLALYLRLGFEDVGPFAIFGKDPRLARKPSALKA